MFDISGGGGFRSLRKLETRDLVPWITEGPDIEIFFVGPAQPRLQRPLA